MLRECDKLCLRDGILYRRCLFGDEPIYQVVIPACLRQQAISGLHDEYGHLGYDRVVDLVRSRFYWPKMAREVKEKISMCDRCIRRKSPVTKKCAALVNITSSYPMELLCIDYLSLEESK